ncbi:hypothetical protein H9623_14295 [Oerskovia sp. Sa1BUA8]|uniref:Uncharacterized protein n=1 Tax=Oerskovia douganii TaxID=2762210 RepID=A0A9D5UAS6_9CELL|nr:hypothetical protein [Oerskovia douganii]MBE7701460.1 hypothetical protein [Oerskovia douganii]
MCPADPITPTDDPAPGAGAPAPRRRSRRVVRPGTEQAGVAGLGSDDDAAAWGDVRPGAAADNHDAELLRDVPPHWS